MRSIWKGSISFGLVYIPVRLYAATEDRTVHFNLLHGYCGMRIRYRRWCDACNREVPAEDVVRAYRWAPDEYVVVSDEDLANLPVPTAKTIAIRDFVRLEEVDPIYFDRSYYLEPVEGGGKAYALLREAMERTQRVAVAKVALRSKESLACVRVYDHRVLLLETMHFPDEIRSPQTLKGLDATADVDPEELELAVDLIERLARPFQPDRYHDAYREALLAQIEAKVRGREITVPPAPETPRVVDLMEALRASLAEVERAQDEAERAGTNA